MDTHPPFHDLHVENHGKVPVLFALPWSLQRLILSVAVTLCAASSLWWACQSEALKAFVTCFSAEPRIFLYQ